MLVETNVYKDEKLGPEVDLKEIVHYIESVKDIGELVQECLKRQIDGYDTKIESQMTMNGNFVGETLAISFTKGKEWKYIMARLGKPEEKAN